MNYKRKLIAEPLLKDLAEDFNKGVPLATLIRNYQLEVSPPHLRKLLFIYSQILDESMPERHARTLRASLFPAWLTEGVQVQPDNWGFLGKFPLGNWEEQD